MIYILKVMGSLIGVPWLANNEEKAIMRYIYEAMDRAKETIHYSFNNNKEKYKQIFNIINERWECQLHHPLYPTYHYLNPQLFYKDSYIETNQEVVRGYINAMKNWFVIVMFKV